MSFLPDRSLARLLSASLACGWAILSPSFAAEIPAGAPLPNPSPSAAAAEQTYSDEIGRDYPIRTLGRLLVTNLRGGIAVHGWALDKVRVKARRVVTATSSAEAARLFAAMDFRYRDSDGEVELAAEYGRGLDVKERLRERASPRARMEMTVWAPASLSARILGMEREVSVRNWNADLDIRSRDGRIQVEDVRADMIAIVCPSCGVGVRDAAGSVRILGGAAPVSLEDVAGGNLYVETGAGDLSLNRVKGEQMYVTSEGAVVARALSGRFEFRTRSGRVDIRDGRGFASGATESGAISVQMREWKFLERAFFETKKGQVTLTLPERFSGEVDLWSVKGDVQMEFPVREPKESRDRVGPEPVSRRRGVVADGGDLLRIFTVTGNVSVLRGLF